MVVACNLSVIRLFSLLKWNNWREQTDYSEKVEKPVINTINAIITFAKLAPEIE